MLGRAEEMVHMETKWPRRKTRQILETNTNTIRDCQNMCQEAIVIREYVDKISGASLFYCVTKEGLTLKIREGVLFLKDNKKTRKTVEYLLRLVYLCFREYTWVRKRDT